MKNKTKLYLLTGFLGAGKTTFLTNVLEDLPENKVAVIMNEFGKVGIDGSLIQKAGMELVEINSGSVFCSCLQLDFVSALVEMADRNMEYVFVESSGLADPSNIGDFLEAVEFSKGDVYDYSGAICLIDGVNFLEQVEDIETVERQINDKADIVESINGNIDYNFLERNLMENQWVESEDTTNTPENKPKTLTLTYDGGLTKEKLSQFLDIIKGDSYRIKGFFKLEDGWNQVDVVGKIIDYKKTDKGEKTSELVIISKIGNQIIRPIFNAWEEVVGKEMKLR